MAKEAILISACLLPIPCQYNGQLASARLSMEHLNALDTVLIPVCPEQLGGLPTPRKPVEIQGGDGADVLYGDARVISADGEDFTAQFVQGANSVLKVATITGARRMITQYRSPSCGCTGIYDGTFSHTLRTGDGVCAALLRADGVELVDIQALLATLDT